jgi:hypothetical protein
MRVSGRRGLEDPASIAVLSLSKLLLERGQILNLSLTPSVLVSDHS